MSKFIGTFSHKIESREIICHLYQTVGTRAKLVVRDGEVRVYCPDGVGSGAITQFLDQSKDFLLRNTRSDGIVLDLSPAAGVSEKLAAGTLQLPIFAENYTCRLAGAAVTPRLEISGSEVLLFCRSDQDLRLAMISAIKSMVVEAGNALSLKYEDILKLRRPFRIEARKLVGKWGCCHSSGLIELDWRSIFLPPNLFGYLVAHEFAHLKEMNHGRQFWHTVAALHPEYRQEDRELDHSLKMMPKL